MKPSAFEGTVRDQRDGLRFPIYLDYQATTPTDARVVAAMMPFFSDTFGNPHSRSHAFGRAAEDAVEAARAKIAGLIGAESREIVFTSGATEANNLAIKGSVRFRRSSRDHVVTCVTEHKCVLESVRSLEREGVRVTWLPVQPNGLIDLGRLASIVDDRTALVSIMAVNNEIGAIQPLAAIGALCHERGALFHTDAAQAAGKLAINVDAMNIDLLSLSAHKLYGPKGIGALYVRRRPRVRLVPLFDGGGQERGYRSGTLPTPLCVGFGEACRIATSEMAEEARRLALLSRRLRDQLTERGIEFQLNGDPELRVAGNLNLAFAGLEAEALLAALPDLAMSTGSACTSAAVEPSYVLRALGLTDDLAGGSIRIGLGRFTTEREVDYAVTRLAEAVACLRQDGGMRRCGDRIP